MNPVRASHIYLVPVGSILRAVEHLQYPRKLTEVAGAHSISGVQLRKEKGAFHIRDFLLYRE